MGSWPGRLKTAASLSACGESGADLVIVEASESDAGYYPPSQGKSTWWDATNAALPDFHPHIAWVTALTARRCRRRTGATWWRK